MEYNLIYSDRKSISISVKEGKIVVRAPKNTPLETVTKILERHVKWIKKQVRKSEKERNIFEGLTEDKIAQIRKEARIYFKDKTESYSKIMGLNYGRITISSAKTRFGSCSSKGNISYSYRLMFYPEAAREYVVVHELAHILEMNHSKKFYSIIEKVLLDHKERRQLLR